MPDKQVENKLPKHIGIIMDGNRRWAKERNLPTIEGHRKGYEKVKAMPEWFYNRGVEVVSIYAFSTENWNRGRDEVNYLMKLAKKALQDGLEEFHEKGYKLFLSGRIEELPGDLPDLCQEAESKTKDNTKGVLNICLNYGGRAEIIDAVRKMVKNDVKLEQVHEGMLRKYFYQGDLSDPDIIIRTSGEQRLSGFQLWQSAYSELVFLEKYWPDFEESDVEMVMEVYKQRNRRFGGNFA
jgi:undecaprenyl diphosphate synthase